MGEFLREESLYKGMHMPAQDFFAHLAHICGQKTRVASVLEPRSYRCYRHVTDRFGHSIQVVKEKSRPRWHRRALEGCAAKTLSSIELCVSDII